jgi:hypothetical protein
VLTLRLQRNPERGANPDELRLLADNPPYHRKREIVNDDFRPFVPAAGSAPAPDTTDRAHAEFVQQRPRAKVLWGQWADLAALPFFGITTDGERKSELYVLGDNGAPTVQTKAAAEALLRLLSADERSSIELGVTSHLWRHWQNTEVHVEHHGLWLDAVKGEVRSAVADVLRASLSSGGYKLSRDVMRLNQFIGELIGVPKVMGEWTYTFSLFGPPSLSAPWGWQLFGHHLSINCVFIGNQMVLTPCFLGSEPTHADSGPFAGTRVFDEHFNLGLDLINSLDSDQRQRAIIADSLLSDDLPPGRHHFADHLMLAGAFQDNRVVPYEGISVAEFSADQLERLMLLFDVYIDPLPEMPRAQRRQEIEQHLSSTHFCWVGGHQSDSVFYYRIQSPVIFIEFDHHSGIFLTNEKPAQFHVHTIVRTPNGNDYGIDLLRQHYEHGHSHAAWA